MGTNIRPEISKRSSYWISRHRFYELKHFCLQYPEWKEELKMISLMGSPYSEKIGKSAGPSDPVLTAVLRRELLTDHLDMVDKAAKACSEDLGNYIFKGVTEGISYEYLTARMDVPCCKETYYESFRRFFWILSKLRK